MSAPPLRPPRLSMYFLGGVFLVLLLIPVWTMLLQRVIQPDQLMNPEVSMTRRLLWWVGFPVILVFAVVGARWQAANKQAEAAKAVVIQADDRSAAAKEQERREYVLEVISMGVTLDKYRQGALWDALSRGHGYASIRDPNPKSYPWSEDDKAGISGGRCGSTLENAVEPTPKYWVTPAFFGGPPILNPQEQISDIDATTGLADGTRSSGLSWNLFAAAGWESAERPDRLMERVFAFFDQHPDMPYVVVSSYDDVALRDRLSLPDTPRRLKDGHYMPEMPDTSAMLVLARRERVDPIRPFAFEDVDEDKVDMDTLNRRGIARRLFLAHADLEESVPRLPIRLSRPPTVAEWLQVSAAFAKRADIYDRSISLLHPLGNNTPSRDFKPTPWFPIPWNKEQLATFDRLATLGYLHRPVFVKTVDEQGKPLTRRDARVAALAAGWQQALLTLPEAQLPLTPTHVVVATGGDTAQTIALTSVLNDWTAHGGPQLDAAKPSQWIDTDARLGNTGAATWFMEMAIGVLGSYREGGLSAAINLRDPAEASIMLISPPPEDKRAMQQGPLGGDVLRNNQTPAIDPNNYKQP